MIDETKTLILGGAGFIGSNLVKKFLGNGYQVTVIDGLLAQTGGKKEHLAEVISKIDFIPQELANVSKLHNLIQTAQIIIDCLGWTRHRLAMDNPGYDFKLNVLSHLPLIENLKGKSGKKVIFLGSRVQYGNLPNPTDVQGIHKLAAEALLKIYSKLYKFNVVSLRFGNCFGIGQPTNGQDIGLIGSFIRDLLAKKQITIFGQHRRRSIVYVNDLCEVILKIASKNFQEFLPLNLNGRTILIEDLAKKLIKIVGGSYQIAKLSSSPIDQTENPPLAEAKIRHLIDDTPTTDLELALTVTINYLKKTI